MVSRGSPTARGRQLRGLRRWCQDTANTERGRIVLSNVRFDIAQKSLNRDELRKFFASVIRRWRRHTLGQVPEKLVVAITHQPHANYCCQGEQIPGSLQASRVMLAVDFVRDNVKTERTGEFDPFEDVPDDFLTLVEQQPEKFLTNELPYRTPYAWVTQTSAIDALRKTLSRSGALAELADQLRNRLGLLNYVGADKLVEIEYPQTIPPAPELIRPTFLDGSSLIVYRSNKRSDGWGTAIDLATGQESMPEAIHRPVPLPAPGYFVRPLGRLSSIHINVNFKALFEACPMKWGPEAVREVEAYLDRS